MISRLAATGIVAVAALLGVVAQAPTVWSPLNVLGFIPAIRASVLVGGAAILARLSRSSRQRLRAGALAYGPAKRRFHGGRRSRRDW